MTVRKGQIVELDIEKMAVGGSGVARADGLVLFVKGAVAGDRVLAKVYKKKKDWAEARVTEIIDPSEDRIPAPCPYSGYCGGCQWQQVRYDRQLAYKTALVEEAVRHIGGLPHVPVRDAIASADIFGYRNKMEFSFSDRRWFLPREMSLKDAEGGFALGLHIPGTYNKVLDVDACLLQQDAGNGILNRVKRFARESSMAPYGVKTHEGFWRYLALRHSRARDEWMVNVVTSDLEPEAVKPLVDRLVAGFGGIRTVVNNINRGRAAIAVGEAEEVLFGDGFIEDNIGPFSFRISANSFFQTNTRGARRLYETVLSFADLSGGETVADLYSGTGTIPIFLSRHVGEVTGFELSAGAVADARINCRQNGIDNCRFVIGDIREKLAEAPHRPDVMIIDPPRAGMHKDAVAGVLAARPRKIVYVSCNPATLARDLKIMCEDYHILEIQPVDMFPHTHHIEAVANLRRIGG
ncbi:MAG: 23S rRNA (uracil(1939)-C(5))-methyltransferase RlmD [Deltaproteobacteria bacterium]|nr:23S rRNA (uracil(1939)-C(5))-methyltransferase RlmD [Deltaproteobacteria bacterium]